MSCSFSLFFLLPSFLSSFPSSLSQHLSAFWLYILTVPLHPSLSLRHLTQSKGTSVWCGVVVVGILRIPLVMPPWNRSVCVIEVVPSLPPSPPSLLSFLGGQQHASQNVEVAGNFIVQPRPTQDWLTVLACFWLITVGPLIPPEYTGKQSTSAFE